MCYHIYMVRNILGKGWGFPVAVDVHGNITLSSYEKNVEESIRIILGTTPGERVMNPDFGCKINDIIFSPGSPKTVSLAIHYIEEAIEGKEYCKFLIENKAYYVSKNFVDQNKKNLLEEFNSKCISVNLKKNAISNNEVCPEGKLIITKENINKFKQNLIDKLSEENEDLIQYVTPVDGTEDYNIYIMKRKTFMNYCQNI